MRLTTLGLLIIALMYGLVDAVLPTEAQQAGNVSRIGFLYPGSAASGASSGLIEAFRQGLREYGWVEGQNIVVEYRYAEGKYKERFPPMAKELARLKVDLIVASTTPGTRAAVQATTTIPIVFNLVADPVASGFVSSLARPGGNVTGLSHMTPELAGKHLEMLAEVKPGLSRVAFLADPNNPAQVRTFEQMQRDAKQLALTLQFLEVSSSDQLKQDLAMLTREGVDALFVHIGHLTERHIKEIAKFSQTHQLPTITNSKSQARNGLLMFYGPSNADLFRRTALYVDKILRGAKPADLPVEQPRKFDLVINLKTAMALGLTMPSTLLLLADEVIR